MKRRDFLRLGAAATVAAQLPALARNPGAAGAPAESTATAPVEPDRRVDVVVYGSTPGGIAAAVTAARRGCRVILACPKRHAGGMLASGLGGLDAKRGDLASGFVLEFRQRMADVYRRRKDAGEPEWRLKAPKRGSNEPSAVEAMFDAMMQEQAPRLEFLRAHPLASAITRGGRVVDAVFDAPGGKTLRIAARTFIDATYEGDLAAAAGVPYRVGRESREEFGESLAGIIYLRAQDGKEIVTSDTGSASPAIQAYCARCVFTTDPDKLVPFVKPETYEQHLPDLWPLLLDFESGRLVNRTYGKAVPGNKWELNGSIDQQTSLNCPGVGWAWPEADPRRRATLEKFHLDHAASFFWFLQNEPRVPARVRSYWKLAGRHRDEFPDNDHWPWQIYVRQGRRIEGRARVTQHSFTRDPRTGLTPRVQHPIAIGDYGVDVHPCHDRRFAVQNLLEGAIWFRTAVQCPTEAGQIPYEALLPEKLDNLLVPVALSSSHIGMAVARMEPVWMNTGTIAGMAAAESHASGIDAAHLDPIPLATKAGIVTDPSPRRIGRTHFNPSTLPA